MATIFNGFVVERYAISKNSPAGQNEPAERGIIIMKQFGWFIFSYQVHEVSALQARSGVFQVLFQKKNIDRLGPMEAAGDLSEKNPHACTGSTPEVISGTTPST